MDEELFYQIEDSVDHQIIMHCAVHFSGSFEEMIRYYRSENVGIQGDFSIRRIQEIATLCKETEGLVELLGEPEQKAIEIAKDRYQSLRACYEQNFLLPHLIADLILAEDEYAKSEIEALVSYEKPKDVTKTLIELMTKEDFYNPLFPGYGRAPILAVRALGKLGAEESIAPLFQKIGKHDFDTDEEIFSALHTIGEKAKQWLLKRLTNFPITSENQQAALALLRFEEKDVKDAFAAMLQKEETRKIPSFVDCLLIKWQDSSS